MAKVLKLLTFLTYTIVVFFIDNYYILGACILLNMLIIGILKISFKKILKNLLFLSGFILITVLTNLVLGTIREAILVGIRLIVVCNITNVFKYILSPMELTEAIKLLFYPIKIFGSNPEDVGIIVCMCITFIPILSNELTQIRYALSAKGVRSSKYVFKPFIYNVLKRTSEVSNSLKAKGYTEG